VSEEVQMELVQCKVPSEKDKRIGKQNFSMVTHLLYIFK
jgi:hypothetical protein